MFIVASGVFGLLKDDRSSDLLLGAREYSLELADSPEERAIGLSGRDHLSSSSGMVFVYESASRHGIWMKDTRIPLDIIWLNSKGFIVTIQADVKPETYPEVFVPDKDSLYVIELVAGEVNESGIEVGDQIDISGYVLGLQGA